MNDLKTDFDSLEKLAIAILNDPVINKKVVNILRMDSYKRCLILNNWLEQLRRNNASKKLTQALSCFFDDSIAEKMLSLINNRQI